MTSESCRAVADGYLTQRSTLYGKDRGRADRSAAAFIVRPAVRRHRGYQSENRLDHEASPCFWDRFCGARGLRPVQARRITSVQTIMSGQTRGCSKGSLHMGAAGRAQRASAGHQSAFPACRRHWPPTAAARCFTTLVGQPVHQPGEAQPPPLLCRPALIDQR